MANKNIKKCSMSLLINENDIEILPHSSENASRTTTHVGEGDKTKEPAYTFGGNAN
jgi:hypothetical protein